jgi:hypothetical protein
MLRVKACGQRDLIQLWRVKEQTLFCGGTQQILD